jgi:hypothetical protein
MVKCNLCGQENDENMMYSCFNKNVQTFECVDERGCKNMRGAYQKQIDEEKKRLLNKMLEQYQNTTDDTYIKHLSKEEQFNIKYKYNFDDLVESPIKFRDGCIHYTLPTTDLRFTWSRFDKNWKLTSNEITKALNNTHVLFQNDTINLVNAKLY